LVAGDIVIVFTAARDVVVDVVSFVAAAAATPAATATATVSTEPAIAGFLVFATLPSRTVAVASHSEYSRLDFQTGGPCVIQMLEECDSSSCAK